MPPSKVCQRCRAPAALMCQRCHDGYCSPDCQISDWSQHKQQCIPMPTLVPITLSAAVKHVPLAAPSPAATAPVSAAATGRPGPLPQPTVMPRALKPATTLEIEAAKVQQKQQQAPQPPQPTPPIAPLQQRLLQAATKAAVPPPATPIAVPPPSQSTPAAATTNIALQALLQRRRQPSSASGNSSDSSPSPKTPAATPPPSATSPAVLAATSQADVASRPTPPQLPAAVRAAVVPPQPPAAARWQPAPPLQPGAAHTLLVQHVDADDPSILWTIDAHDENACLHLLATINAALEAPDNASPVPAAGDIAVGSLFVVPFEDVYYRAVVLKDHSCVQEVYFQLIDYGNRMFVQMDSIRVARPEWLEVPAFGRQVRLRQRRLVAPAVGEQLSVRVLEALAGGGSGGVVYRVEEERQQQQQPQPQPQPAATVTTAAAVGPKVSACVERPPAAAAEPAAKPPPAAAPVRQQPVAPPTVPAATPPPPPARFSMTDLTVLPLPVGQPLQLSCLDTSELENGLITAAVFDVDRLRHVTQVLTARIAEFCTGPLAVPMRPQPGELCLAIYEEDASWYRALCLDATAKADDVDKVQVMFVDYGNVTLVSAANVRNIPEELVRDPCLANSCVIEGVPDLIPLERIRSHLEANPVFPIVSATAIENQCYVIHVEL